MAGAIEPQNYFVNPVQAERNYTQPAAVENCTPDPGYNRCIAYTYEGTDQAFVVPTGVSEIHVKAWGAGGGGSIATSFNIGAPGGSGAYVAGVLSTTPGSQYTVMVGQGGGADGTPGSSSLCANGAYGFGGSCSPPRTNYVDGGGGGGLSGLFTGSAAITANDQARAVFVAGGGGSSEGTNSCANGQSSGGAGGNGFAGTMPTMRGVDGAINTVGSIFPTATGGGGGYFGGSATTRLSLSSCPGFGSANGGSNFITGTGVTDPINLAGTETAPPPQFTTNAPPRTTEQQYLTGVGVGNVALNTPGGNGLVVIQWFLAPTAAQVSISGRVLAADGRGISRAKVTLTDAAGESRTAITNLFGYYSFDGVLAGQTYLAAVSAKGYVFGSQVITADDDIKGLNFVALGGSIRDFLSYLNAHETLEPTPWSGLRRPRRP